MLITWIATAIAVWATAVVLPGFSVKNGAKGALVVAAVFGLLNALFGRFLLGLFKLGTLGLASLLGPVATWLVMALLLVVTDKLSDTLKIKSFGWAFISAIPIAIGTELLKRVMHAVF